MRENRAARFGKQANHEKRGKTSIRHRDQVKQQQKNNQTNKEGGAKKGKRRHDCKANHTYECIKRFQNYFLARFRLFFSPRVSCVISYLLDAMLGVKGCSNVTVRVKGSHDRNSNRYSSLPSSK